jgi:putative transposase
VQGARHQHGDVLQGDAQFGGMDTSMMSKIKELEEANRRLRRTCAKEKHKAEILAEALAKEW